MRARRRPSDVNANNGQAEIDRVQIRRDVRKASEPM